ncbi:O-unit flippase-like protein [Qipengyuania sp. MTN3-11]|uniref:O-unit flippase-like protein n=1 Tax=Qipengyuania sp. MTN3-11 TaxID=3056557 RepID=UPI0036F2AC1F
MPPTGFLREPTTLLFLARLRANSAVVVGGLAQMLQYGSGLILLPLVVTRLSAPEVGIWYIFIALQGLVALADFGFQPTFARSFSSAYAGARTIERHGHAETTGEPNLPLVMEVLRLCRRFYALLAAGVVVLMTLIGVFYLPEVVRGAVPFAEVAQAWMVFSLGTALMLYFSWNAGFLLGAGRVSSTYWGQIASRGGFVLIGGGALLLDWGLMGLAVGNLVSVLLARVILQFRLLPLLRALNIVPAPGAANSKALFKALWPNASRMGMVSLGGFLITRLNVLVASAFFSLEVAASYAVTLQLLTAVGSVSQLPINVAVPEMVRMRVQGNRDGLHRTWLIRQAALLALFVTGVAFVAFAAEFLLASVGSSVALLPLPLILLMGMVLLLETNHASCALVITTGNTVPFVKAALLSGIAVAILSIAGAWAGLGVAALILAPGIVQLAYNNWKWPLLLWSELKP